MNLTEDARRMLQENLRKGWQKFSVIAGVLLGWLPVYAAAGLIWQDKVNRILITVEVYAVAGILFILYCLFSSLRGAYEKLGPEVPTHRALCDLSGKFFGVLKRIHVVNMVVHGDGSSEATHDVKLEVHARNVTQIEYRCSTPQVPDDVEGCIEITAEPRHESGVRISTAVLQSDRRESYWSINFIPGLNPGQVISYRFHQKVAPKAFAANVEEMRKRNLQLEFYSRCVTYPTEKLRIRVAFDKDIEPQTINYDVWLGKGQVRHMAEFVRVETSNSFRTGTDEDGRVYGEFDILHPIHGLLCVLLWQPPKGGAEKPS